MSQPEHSPEPWSLRFVRHDLTRQLTACEVVAADGTVVHWTQLDVGEAEARRYAADARLIAAAPKLLAACKLARDRLKALGLDWLGKRPDPLDAALAEAEGTEAPPAAGQSPPPPPPKK